MLVLTWFILFTLQKCPHKHREESSTAPGLLRRLRVREQRLDAGQTSVGVPVRFLRRSEPG